MYIVLTLTDTFQITFCTAHSFIIVDEFKSLLDVLPAYVKLPL